MKRVTYISLLLILVISSCSTKKVEELKEAFKEGVNKSVVDQTLVKVASQLNKTLPMEVDSETRLDNTMALPNKVFQYNYTLVNMLSTEVDTTQLLSFVKPNVINNIKTNPQMSYFRDNEVSVNYLYKDKEGNFITLLKVTPEEYQ